MKYELHVYLYSVLQDIKAFILTYCKDQSKIACFHYFYRDMNQWKLKLISTEGELHITGISDC